MGKLSRISLPAPAPASAPDPPRFYAESPLRAITPEHVSTELTRLALSNVADIISIDPSTGVPTVDLSSASREALSAISAITSTTRTIYNAKGEYLGEETTVRISLTDKLKALELAGRNLGMFKPQELHVTHDLADRLLAARARLISPIPPPTKEPSDGL